MKRRNHRPDNITLFLTSVALLLAGIAWRQDGLLLGWEGLRQSGNALLSVVPLLLAAFLVAGLTQVMIAQELVQRWLGASAGWRGIALACLGGALIPGGPYVYYPIAAVMLRSGAGLGVLVAFVTAKNLLSVSRLPLEFALLGTCLSLVRFAASLVAPPVLGLLADALFGRRVEAIREAMIL